MDKIIIYPSEKQFASKISVARYMYVAELTADDTAKRIVPNNIPYLILDLDALPTDETFRNAWTADFTNPTGYGIGPERWFIQQAEKEIAAGVDVEKNQRVIQSMKDEILRREGVAL